MWIILWPNESFSGVSSVFVMCPDSSHGWSDYQGVGVVPTSGKVNLDPPSGARGKINGCDGCAVCAGCLGLVWPSRGWSRVTKPKSLSKSLWFKILENWQLFNDAGPGCASDFSFAGNWDSWNFTSQENCPNQNELNLRVSLPLILRVGRESFGLPFLTTFADMWCDLSDIVWTTFGVICEIFNYMLVIVSHPSMP